MGTIITRQGKGSVLTYEELDNNFKAIAAEINKLGGNLVVDPGQNITPPIPPVLARLSTATPLHYQQPSPTTLLGTVPGSTVTGVPAGMTLTGTALTGTPTVRSALLNESLAGVSRNTLVFAPETAARTMMLGMNLSGLANYYNNDVFIDHLKYSVINVMGTLDANGIPQTMGTDGNGNSRVSFQVPMPDGRTTPVKMRVVFDGDADFRIDTLGGGGFAGAFTKEGSDWVINYSGPPGYADQTTCYFQYTAIRNPGTKIALIRDDQATLFKAGEIFQPAIIAKLQGFLYFRDMNWSDANYPDPISIPDNYITYTAQGTTYRCVPFNIRAALAKRANIGWWCCSHIKITNAQSQACYPRFDEVKALGLPLRRELSNEIWNSQFPQYESAKTLGAQAGYGPSSPQYNAEEGGVWFNGYRTAQLAALDRGRGYLWCLGCQPAVPAQSARIFQGFGIANGVYSDVSIWITTDYAGGSMTQTADSIGQAQYDKQQAWALAGDYDAIVDNLLNYIGPNSFSVAAVKLTLQQHVAIATAKGWACETYEGNWHLNSYFAYVDHPALEAAFLALTTHPLMQPATTQRLEVSQEVGIRCSCVFDRNSTPPDSKYGNFGVDGRPSGAALISWQAAGGAPSPIVAPTLNNTNGSTTLLGTQVTGFAAHANQLDARLVAKGG